MKRREVLAAGSLGSVALGTGCAPSLIVPGGFNASSALSELDRSLAQTGSISSSLGGAAFACAPGVPVERFRENADRVTEICAEGARALMVTAFFHGLAPDERVHPAIQTRMRAELPRIGSAMVAMADAVEQVGPRERQAIQDHLRGSPGLEDRIASEVDGYASRSNAPFAKEVQLRRQMGDVAWRMRQQPADVVIDEILAKFRKGEAYQRAHADQLLALARPPGQPPVAGPLLHDAALGGSGPPAAASPPTQDGWYVPGGITALAGLGTLGLGIVAGFVAPSTLGLGGATLAVLLVSTGLIVLVIGLLMLAIGGIGRVVSGGPREPPAPAAPAPSAPAPASEHPPEQVPL